MRPNSPLQLFPLVRIAACLILGLLVGGRLSVLLPPWTWLFVFAAVVAVAGGLRRHGVGQGVAILLATVLLGIFLMVVQEHDMQVPLDDGRPQMYKAVLTAEPVERGKVIRCDLLVTTGCLAGRRVKAAILRDTLSGHYRRLHVGDGLVAVSAMDSLRNFRQSNFNYVRYLQCHGFVATTFVHWRNWHKAVVSLSGLSLVERTRLAALRLRQRLIGHYRQSGMSGQGFAVVMAMTLGDKSMLSELTRDVYSVSGASHVLALSGLHLGIVYMLLSLLTMGRRGKVWFEVLTLTAIWGYVVLVGMSASVVRAAIMITVYALMGMVNRHRMSLNTLALAAIVMLVANPMTIYDVGFQLSFVAVLSILVLFRPVFQLLPEPWLMRHRLLRGLWSMVVVSCAAQVGVAPLVVYYFGRFSCYFLLTNFLVIPAATLILYLSAAVLVAAYVPFLQQGLASLLMLCVDALNRSLTWIASLPGAAISPIRLTPVDLYLIYALIVLLVWGVLSLCRKHHLIA